MNDEYMDNISGYMAIDVKSYELEWPHCDVTENDGNWIRGIISDVFAVWKECIGGGRHHEKGVSVAQDPHEIYKETTSEKGVSVAHALNLQANLQKKTVSVSLKTSTNSERNRLTPGMQLGQGRG